MYEVQVDDLPAQVYQRLKDMILNGELTPGQKLVQEDLASNLGVSRTPLLTAFRTLEKELLLEFTNALFTEVFHNMNRNMVELKVPSERKEKAKGGSLETWYLLANNREEEVMATANGIRDLIERTPGVNPGDIAILCRRNDTCKDIATQLERLGVRASVGQGLLMDTMECIFVR